MRQKYLGTDSRSDLSIGLIIIFYSVYKKSLNALIVLRIIISAFVSMNIKHDALHCWVSREKKEKIKMWHQCAKYKHATNEINNNNKIKIIFFCYLFLMVNLTLHKCIGNHCAINVTQNIARRANMPLSESLNRVRGY